ncbi:MAG: hydroxymethylglutaryl-CoA lyase [Bdellovibrio sp.]|nr:hydroxymethylglutaryl-CoA lyase [Bdellovibrio sp.]
MGRESVRIFEVGPRDGLQNEARIVSFQDKLQLVNSLIAAGIKDIELGAFVRADRVPQMADSEKIYLAIQTGKLKLNQARPWCLVPNRKGLERALSVGASHIAVFTAATESFVKRNIGMSIQQSLKEFEQVILKAKREIGPRLKVRGYVSTAFGCPFEGRVRPVQALRVIQRLADIGADEISIGDTIGVATPGGVDALIPSALKVLGVKATAVHFHDTRGTALANALRSLDYGVRIFDSSVGGLGGCPFAPGATGNLATEDLVYMLEGMGMKTGISLDLLCRESLRFSKKMKRPLASRYLQAFATAKPRK